MKTLVIGLGNLILSDDGVGVRLVEAIRQRMDGCPEVTVTEAGVGGLRLMEMAVGYDRVILIDALQREDGPPGEIHRMSLEDLARISATQHSSSAHDTNLVTALALGKRMGLALPREWTIYAIAASDVVHFGEALTPEVARAFPNLVRAVLKEIENPSSNQPKTIEDR